MTSHTQHSDTVPAAHAATYPYRFGVWKTMCAALLSIVLLVSTTVLGIYLDLARQVSDSALDISAFENVMPQSEPEEEPPGDPFTGQAVNILVSGVDSRYGEDPRAYGSSEELSTIQSDTTMVVHLSADRSRIQVVSIPRDLITAIPSCTRSDGSQTRPYDGMFNSAFTTGAVTDDLAGGVACTKATVEQLTGLTIDAFVVVNFSGFKSMVDALGGVWLNLEEEVYDALSGLSLSAGCHNIDSTQALAYARARYNLGDGSDLSRIGRQHQLVGAMFKTLKSKNYLTDLPSLLTFLKATVSALKVSQNLADINTAAGLMLSLTSLERSGLQFITMPNAPAPWDLNRVIEDLPRARPVWEALKSDSAFPIGTLYRDISGEETIVTAPTQATENTAPDSAAPSSSVSESTPTPSENAPATAPAAETQVADSCPPQN
ncbi:LCP family protein [Schaalia sp. lx-260]|uniref:LCP family protein n=1 Tax=Schaalia sp. lx-260 TaxID=2899082 RepID=UPI001E448EDC|nr:LCP family protein [Schaalia sp. lx-260]MCD4549747.1 LCP family protein [Schaalia sp. lx-260]